MRAQVTAGELPELPSLALWGGSSKTVIAGRAGYRRPHHGTPSKLSSVIWERQPGRDTCFGDLRGCGNPKGLGELVPLAARRISGTAAGPDAHGGDPLQHGQWQGKRHVLPGPQDGNQTVSSHLVRLPGEGFGEGGSEG